MYEFVAGVDQAAGGSGDAEFLKRKDEVAAGQFFAQGIGGAVGEVVGLVDDEEGLGGVITVSGLKYCLAAGCEYVVGIANPYF